MAATAGQAPSAQIPDRTATDRTATDRTATGPTATGPTATGPTATGPTAAHPAAALPDLALSRPLHALNQARQVLLAAGDDLGASYAYQAAAIVLRERGEVAEALTLLRAGVRVARRCAGHDRYPDLLATLGTTLVLAGRTREGLSCLDEAAAGSGGDLMARVRLRRAHTLWVLGRCEEALTDLQLALVAVRRSGDVLWQARVLNNRCMVRLALGDLTRAYADADLAEQLFIQIDQAMEAVDAHYNKGIVASRRGSLPEALAIFDTAEHRYRALGVLEPELILDRGWALLAAGLGPEALSSAVTALAETSWQPVKRAQLQLFAARAALACEQPAATLGFAKAAARSFRTQLRPAWANRARFLTCQARFDVGERSSKLLATVVELANALAAARAEETALAYLLAGQLAAERGLTEVAATMFDRTARLRRSEMPLTRATGWLAVALLAASASRPRALRNACARGLDALDEHRLIFGAAELRAVATTHGRDLSSLAIDSVIVAGSARDALRWSERWRATSMADPGQREVADSGLERELATLRDAARRRDTADTGGPGHHREQTESAIRRRRLQLTGSSTGLAPFDISALLRALGDRQLLSLVQSQGALYAIVASAGRVRHCLVGPMAEALREVEFARFALRRAATNRPSRRRLGVALPAQSIATAQLQQALLGPAVRLLDQRPTVIVAPAALQTAPWGLLEALGSQPVSVAPSARMWLRAHCAPRAETTAVTLIAGPQLPSSGAEVAALKVLHPTATVLGAAAGAASADASPVLAALSGTRLAHIAAHGTFRADSPMFSALLLDDGPLFVHDLDRIPEPPHQIILSACDSGVTAAVGADELVGLVSALLRIGTAAVLASVVAVNDEAAVAFMLSVHQSLGAGSTLAEATLAGRLAATEPLAAATAASFNCWGC